MARCRMCHGDYLLDTHGYCNLCKQQIKKNLKNSAASLSSLAKMSDNHMSDVHRQELLMQAKDDCAVLKKYSNTPYYKGNIEADCRRALFLLGGTKWEYREIVGYGHIVKRVVLIVAIAVLIATVGFWLYISGY